MAGPLLRAGVAVSTVVAVLAGLVPVGLVWAGLGLVAIAGSSELLEHTGGLRPTNFGAGYWLGWLLNCGFLLWAAVRAVRRRFGARLGSSYLPLALLAGLYGVVGVSLVVLDVGGVDMPDVLTTTFLVGYMLLWSWVVPFFVTAFILRLAWLAWRGSVLPAAAMRTLAVTGMLALGGGTLTGISVGGLAGGYLPPLLTMAHVEGYTHAEIAGRLAISVGASKKRLQRATRALRRAYERGGD